MTAVFGFLLIFLSIEQPYGTYGTNIVTKKNKLNEVRSTLLDFIFAIHRIVIVINFEITKMPFHFLACIHYVIHLSLKRYFGSRMYLSNSLSEEADINFRNVFSVWSFFHICLVSCWKERHNFKYQFCLLDRCDLIKRDTFSIDFIPFCFENLINVEE